MVSWDDQDGAVEAIDMVDSSRIVKDTEIKKRKSSNRPLNTSAIQIIYTSTVDTPKDYAELRREQHWTDKHVIRKIAGIPFVLLYTLILVYIVSELILKSGSNLSFDFDPGKAAKDICSTISNLTGDKIRVNITKPPNITTGRYAYISGEKRIMATIPTEYKIFGYDESNFTFPNTTAAAATTATMTKPTTTTKSEDISIIFENDSPGLYLVIGSAMGGIGILSWFSRKTRATLLLILPGLITRRSRHLIFAITVGILTNGAVQRIMTNFRKVLDNANCMYRSVIVVACAKKEEYSIFMVYARNLYNTMSKTRAKLHQLACRYERFPPRPIEECPLLKFLPFPYMNETMDVVKELTGPSTKLISQQAEVVMSNASDIVGYVDLIRKLLTLISLVLLVIDAIRYLRSYTTDSSFDNSYIGWSTRRYWQRKEEVYKKKFDDCQIYPLTHWDVSLGLRNWEIKEGLKISNLPKFSKAAILKFLRNCLSTFVFMLFVGLVLGIDVLLAEVLQDIKDSPKFHINVEGVTPNITGKNIHANTHVNLMRYNTKTCLSSPERAPKEDYVIIGFLVVIAISSCLLEMFMSGMKAKLCNLFFPERKEERMDYLYYKVFTGRVRRMFYLLLIVRREIERREGVATFSPWQRALNFVHQLRLRVMKKFVCPGCGKYVKLSEARELAFDMDKKINAEICKNCLLDLPSRQRSDTMCIGRCMTVSSK